MSGRTRHLPSGVTCQREPWPHPSVLAVAWTLPVGRIFIALCKRALVALPLREQFGRSLVALHPALFVIVELLATTWVRVVVTALVLEVVA